MVDNSKRIEAIDNLLLAILASSLVVPTIGQSFGLETRLIWTPTICYSVWIIFTGYIKPRIAYSDSQERSIVERIRGWSYVISLPPTLIVNSIIIPLSPKTLYVYFAAFAVAFLAGFLLTILDITLIKMFFWKEMKCMNETQELSVLDMVTETRHASNWASICILILNFTLIIPENLTLLIAIVILIVASSMLFYSYSRNRKSSKIAKNLSRSLIDSKWSKKYNATISEKEHKDLKDRNLKSA